MNTSISGTFRKLCTQCSWQSLRLFCMYLPACATLMVLQCLYRYVLSSCPILYCCNMMFTRKMSPVIRLARSFCSFIYTHLSHCIVTTSEAASIADYRGYCQTSELLPVLEVNDTYRICLPVILAFSFQTRFLVVQPPIPKSVGIDY